MDIYLDENLSEYVADALNSLNKGYFRDILVISTKTKFGKGATDEVIIPGIGQSEGILITRDINIQKTRLQYAMCQKYNLGIFFLKLPKNQNKHWEIVRLLVNNWEEIIDKSKKEKKPFGYSISPRGKMEKL
uniref:VapC45 PIN like domain-containing protein n=1 Tax=Ignavibacterium album TaxID=591197 RepID=A0A7V2ZKR6_9BACT